MLVHGIRGDEIPVEEDSMTEEELELYGVDWEELGDDEVLASHEENNTDEPETNPPVEQLGQPQHLNEVRLDSPDCPFTDEQISWLTDRLAQYNILQNQEVVIQAWTNGLVYARMLDSNSF